MSKKQLVFSSVALFVAGLAAAWITHGTGVVRDDPKAHIAIPSPLTMRLQVKAAYNASDASFRYRWPSPKPGIFHDMLTFEAGKWVVRGNPVPGSEPHGLHEDRVAMMVDDGSVPEFARYGGYVTVGRRLTGFNDEVSGKEVAAHPYLGAKLKQDELTKYLPATRKSIDDWSSVVPEADLAALRNAGYFLDLWHWRANRSNPVDLSDDQFVAEARLSDAGKGMYATNWDSEKKLPRLMFDPGKAAGQTALKWADIIAGKIGQANAYALREDIAMPFDANTAWKDGDTLPRRIVRPADGSRADIKVAGKGQWRDGFWDVTLTRRMDTGNRREDKILVDRGAYQVAFAVHRQATGGRWHLVSLPFTLGLGRDADIVATRFTGDSPAWEQPWKDVTLFYPGQVSWAHLNSPRHAGAGKVQQGVPVKFRHSEAELAHYGVEMEFNDAIKRQWLLTMLAGLCLIAAFGFAFVSCLRDNDGV